MRGEEKERLQNERSQTGSFEEKCKRCKCWLYTEYEETKNGDGAKVEEKQEKEDEARPFMIRQLQFPKLRRNKTDFHDGIISGCNMCIGSLRTR